MAVLSPPTKRYLLGRRPTHSTTKVLTSNYSHPDPGRITAVLQQGGYLSGEGKPTRRALDSGLVDQCGRHLIWNLDRVSQCLAAQGCEVVRRSVNQEIATPRGGGPSWVNLATVGTYFSASARQVGSWLSAAGLRDAKGGPTREAVDRGLASVVQMSAGGDRTRPVTLWDLYLTQRFLMECGHELDFDYESTLRGTGRNSDVTVTEGMDARVREVAGRFLALFRDPGTRYQCVRLVGTTPRPVLREVERLLGREPGWLTEERYKEHIRYR